MKKLACRDAGILDCNWEIVAETDEEVLRQAREHGLRAHNFKPSPADEQKMRTLIRNV